MLRAKVALLKVVVMGQTKSGKTRLVRTFVRRPKVSTTTTVVQYFQSKNIYLSKKEGFEKAARVTISIADTPGRVMSDVHGFRDACKDSDACIIVFDVCDRSSYDDALSWMERFMLSTGSNTFGVSFPVPVVLFANRIDARNREISSEEVQAFCDKHGCTARETQCTVLQTVDAAFLYVCGRALAHHQEKREVGPMNPPHPVPLSRMRVSHRSEVILSRGVREPVRCEKTAHRPAAMRKLIHGVVDPKMGSEGKMHALMRDNDQRSQREVERILKKVFAHLVPDVWEQPPDDVYLPFTVLTSAELIVLARATREVLMQEMNVVPINAPVKIFGDVHGQFDELMQLFRTYGAPFPDIANGDLSLTNYLFLGDYVDRGSCGLEVVSLLFALKLSYPDRVYLLRGNHETRAQNRDGYHTTFSQEMMGRELEDSVNVLEAINKAFDALPLAAVVSNRVFCCHAGIGRDVKTIAQINEVSRDVEPISPPCSYEEEHYALDRFPFFAALDENGRRNHRIIYDLLWSDPTKKDDKLGVSENVMMTDDGEFLGSRGDAFGPDRVLGFLRENDLQLIVRAHECILNGYEFSAGGRVLTIFSAANYSFSENDASYNHAALLQVDQNLACQIKALDLNEEGGPDDDYGYSEGDDSEGELESAEWAGLAQWADRAVDATADEREHQQHS